MQFSTLCRNIHFIENFKPAVHPGSATQLMIRLQHLPREAMQDVCQALIETGIRYHIQRLPDVGEILAFEKQAYSLVLQACTAEQQQQANSKTAIAA